VDDCDVLYQYLDQLQWLNRTTLEQYTDMWKENTIDNYEYISRVNEFSGRTFHDICQYPVFPWIIQKYDTTNLELNKRETFRTLSLPIKSVSNEKFVYIQDNEKKNGISRKHFSDPSDIRRFIQRKFPNLLSQRSATTIAPFNDICEEWRKCNEDVNYYSELIPEFYSRTLPSSPLLSNVKLPSWSRSTEDFVSKMRSALECPLVTRDIHKWIDLIFGVEQRKGDNIFHELSYKYVDVKNSIISNVYPNSLMEIGYTPLCVFKEEHISKTVAIPEPDDNAVQEHDSDDPIVEQPISISPPPDIVIEPLHRQSSNSSSSSSTPDDSQKLYQVINNLKRRVVDRRASFNTASGAVVTYNSLDNTIEVSPRRRRTTFQAGNQVNTTTTAVVATSTEGKQVEHKREVSFNDEVKSGSTDSDSGILSPRRRKFESTVTDIGSKYNMLESKLQESSHENSDLRDQLALLEKKCQELEVERRRLEANNHILDQKVHHKEVTLKESITSPPPTVQLESRRKLLFQTNVTASAIASRREPSPTVRRVITPSPATSPPHLKPRLARSRSSGALQAIALTGDINNTRMSRVSVDNKRSSINADISLNRRRRNSVVSQNNDRLSSSVNRLSRPTISSLAKLQAKNEPKILYYI
jgi:hypothetical protein